MLKALLHSIFIATFTIFLFYYICEGDEPIVFLLALWFAFKGPFVGKADFNSESKIESRKEWDKIRKLVALFIIIQTAEL